MTEAAIAPGSDQAGLADNVGLATVSQHDALLQTGAALPKGGFEFIFSVPSIHCGGCISKIEHAVTTLPGVDSARVNLTLKRLRVVVGAPRDIIEVDETLTRIGFPATPIDLGDASEGDGDKKASSLLRAMGVAGFAAGN
ncbi:MAG: heavy metal-associated domain-containing protein, partial [Hyphomicrobiales bacterium]